jgi:hypothetical protein
VTDIRQAKLGQPCYGATPDSGALVSTIAPSTRERDGAYPVAYSWAGYLVFGLLGIGVVGTVPRSNPVLEAGLPLGFSLWAVLYGLIRRRDARRPDA